VLLRGVRGALQLATLRSEPLRQFVGRERAGLLLLSELASGAEQAGACDLRGEDRVIDALLCGLVAGQVASQIRQADAEPLRVLNRLALLELVRQRLARV
jgi:hypothetical protein